VSFSPFGLQEISVLFELTLVYLRYYLTVRPPQLNSPSNYVILVEGSKLLRARNPEGFYLKELVK